MRAEDTRVSVVGAGIGGLVTALSLAEVGARVDVYERVREMRPLGVGINLLPHAVRELDALELLAPLLARAVAPATLAYYSHRGQAIWREPRGAAAGYPWPQLSIHRGALQEVLLDAFVDRVGIDHLHLGHRLRGVESDADRARATFAIDGRGDEVGVTADAVIAADGIHSAARSQRHPLEGHRGGTAHCSGAGSPSSTPYWMVAR